jgi:hypothetical protein
MPNGWEHPTQVAVGKELKIDALIPVRFFQGPPISPKMAIASFEVVVDELIPFLGIVRTGPPHHEGVGAR